MEFRTKREAEEAILDAAALLEAEATTYAATSPRRQEMEKAAARIRALLPTLPD